MEIKRIDENSLYEKYGLPYNNYVNSVKYVDGQIPYLTFKKSLEYDYFKISMSTRLGGVSTGFRASMNLGFYNGDDDKAVTENFMRFGDRIGIKPERMVYSKQTHTTNVLVIDEKDCGKGVVCERDYDNIDGLITNSNNVGLVISYADCVPVFIVDTNKKVIAASHSGWRGTVNNITQVTINKMRDIFDSDAKDCIAFIGPSICQSCYEVSEDLYDEFKLKYSNDEINDLFRLKDVVNKKYELNLHLANVLNLMKCGIDCSNIFVTDICTCCNPQILFSHRASAGKRGINCGFIELL